MSLLKWNHFWAVEVLLNCCIDLQFKFDENRVINVGRVMLPPFSWGKLALGQQITDREHFVKNYICYNFDLISII